MNLTRRLASHVCPGGGRAYTIVTSGPGTEPDQANPARVYDLLLGGSHNFASDRAFAAQVQETWPDAARTMHANRAFLGRAVRYLAAEADIRQFLDIGSGLPTMGNVHEVAQQAAPGTHVVYVDHDPVAVQHSRVLLAGNDDAAVIRGDLRCPQDIVTSPELRSLLDLTRPVGLLLVAVLHFIPDEEDPATAVAWLRDQLPFGSYLVISHATADRHGAEVTQAAGMYASAMPSFRLRTHAEISGFFGGFGLIEPGLVFLPGWRPDNSRRAGKEAGPAAGYCGVAVKR
jgi:S-adenosyl methyltransferase